MITDLTTEIIDGLGTYREQMVRTPGTIVAALREVPKSGVIAVKETAWKLGDPVSISAIVTGPPSAKGVLAVYALGTGSSPSYEFGANKFTFSGLKQPLALSLNIPLDPNLWQGYLGAVIYIENSIGSTKLKIQNWFMALGSRAEQLDPRFVIPSLLDPVAKLLTVPVLALWKLKPRKG